MIRIPAQHLIVCATIFAAALSAADDPGGWTAAKWGMTDAQILAALPGQAVRLDPPEKLNRSSVHIPELDVAGTKFHVYFTPDKDGLLSSVLFSPIGSPAQGLDAVFQELQNLLVDKYGRPWKTDEQGNSEIQWSFPTTVITLSRIKVSGFGTQFVHLQYKRKVAVPL